MLPSIWLMLWLQPALSAPKDARQAEAIRLVEEMQRLSQRTAWSGVERQFDKLKELRGVEISADAYLLGAKAAQGTGDIAAARKRAERAIQTAGTDIATLTAASEFLTEFDILNGPVRIDVPSQMEQVPALRSTLPAFDPGLRAALDHANRDLTAKRGFDGYLPLGQYRIGSASFDVLPSEKPIVVIATPGETPAPISAPKPVVTGPDARIVFLAARSEGWTTDVWSTNISDGLTALRDVPGVQLVDAFSPDDDWLVMRATTEDLASRRIEPPAITGLLGEAWTDQETEEGHSWFLAPPYDVTVEAIASKTIHGDMPLSEVGTIEKMAAGAFVVPADQGEVARYRIEVKYAGEDTAPLIEALQTVEALQPLGFKVEERPAQ